MSIFDGVEEIKRMVKQAEEEENKIEGMIKQIAKDREKQYGCKSLKEARKLLKKLEEKERRIAREYVADLQQWKKEHLPRLKEFLRDR